MKLRHPFTCLLLVCSLASANAEENIHGRWTARLKAGSSETLTVDYRGRSLTMKMKKGKTYPPVF